MDDWNSYLSERPHRVYPGPEVFYEYHYVHAHAEESCWHLKHTVSDWMHANIRGCWVLWEDHRYMNNMELYEDCSCMEDCHRHTRPFIAFQNAEDAMMFKLTW